jgi:hypothetical protein
MLFLSFYSFRGYLMKNFSLFSIFFCFALALSLITYSPVSAGVLGDGAHRLVDLQADITADNAGNGFDDVDPDDGGWDWVLTTSDTEHSSSASPENIFGVTAEGVLAGYNSEGGIRLAIGLIDTYMGYEGNPEIDSGTDFAFLCHLSDLTGDPYYADLSKQRWDTKMALYGGADSLAILIRDSRHSQNWDGLIPWDIGLLIEGAVKLHEYFPGQGYMADAIDMADIIYNDLMGDPGYYDMYDDSTNAYYFGLEGIVLSFGLTEVYLGVAKNAVTILMQSQNEDGSWPWNAEYPEADVQGTAYVVMCFGILDLPYQGINNKAQAGSDYLVSVQHENGGWDVYEGDEYPEVDGECLRAISYYPPDSKQEGSGFTGPRIYSPYPPVHPSSF